MVKKEIFLEEAVLDDLARDFDSLEMPLSERAFKLINILTVIVAIIIIGRLFFLNILKSDFYKDRALANSGQTITVRAERGIIFDRFNKPLVRNIPVFRLGLKISELLKDPYEKEQALKSLQNILGMPPDEVKNLLQEVNLEKQNLVVLPRELTVDETIKLKNLNLKSFQIENNFKREYIQPEAMSHILGYVGVASKDDLNNNPALLLNDIVGKAGLESYYDKELKGKDGRSIIYRDVKGKNIDNKLISNPRSGYELQTTIDSEFQIYFYNRLKEGLAALGKDSGAGLALNPRTGEVLALVSIPGFNNNKITPDVLSASNKPLFNRVVSGVYAPGSTIKPLVAFAALNEGIVNPRKEVFSAGYIDIPNPYHPESPSRFFDWKPHGWVNLYSAIARSSNIYFYAIGGGYGDIKGLGIKKLKEYWKKFGLDDPTGIDLPGENNGFLPDPEEKEKRTGEIWRIGDTYNISIGQGDLTITPLELLSYISGIANDGKITRPFIVKKIIAEDRGLIKENSPKINYDYSEFLNYIKEVQRGMMDAVRKPYGTANLLADLPISVAAKTGTAQIEGNQKINALFVGYAPADNPQIAILVLIENAKEGSLNTVPIAKDALKWYYYNRIKL